MDIKKVYEELTKQIEKEKIKIDEPMKNHTTFKTGGNADLFLKLDKIEDIQYGLKVAKEYGVPFFVLGNGSNILVLDKGIRGIVIKPDFKNIIIEKEPDDKVKVKVGAGVMLPFLARKLYEQKIAGMEFACGIPGSIGGAVYMNSGAHGSEMANVVKTTTYLTPEGEVLVLKNQEQDFSYRHSVFEKMQGVIVESELELMIGDKEEIKRKMDENTAFRKAKQPITLPSAGSFFKRGDDFIAAKLIDDCKLKGTKVGGAQVSTLHAGFIVNSGNATSKDIIELAKLVKEKVEKEFGKVLIPEVQIIGEE